MKWLKLLLMLVATPAFALQPVQPGEPPEVNQFLELLRDPEVQRWLSDRQSHVTQQQTRQDRALLGWEAGRRADIENAVAAVPRIPAELTSTAARVRQDALSHGYEPILPLMGGIALIGMLAEKLFRRLFHATNALERILQIGIFAATMAVILLAFPWPALGRMVMWSYLGAFVAYRIAVTSSGMLFENNKFVSRRIQIFVGVAAFAVASSVAGPASSVDAAVQNAISYLFATVLLFLSIETLWAISARRLAVRLGLSLLLVVCWILWCLDFIGLFSLGVYAFVLPPLLRLVSDRLERNQQGTIMPPSGDLECQTPTSGFCTGRMRDRALRADLRRRRRRSAHERSHHVAYTFLAGKDLQARTP